MKWLLAPLLWLTTATAVVAQSAPTHCSPAATRYTPMAAYAPSPASTSTVHPSVVRIVAPGDGSMSFGSGTLVFKGQDYGLVVTNWHVINEATGQISVHFPDGFYSPATVQKIDRDWDLAILAIRKPNVEAVALATQAPQPGEVLTIAGYGSGQYRAASGVCTQYVAPGTTFPFEMVEVAVSARQGDSGGPMLNTRGELAGVLFGEGNGRTSGSYCGRVRWFLASVAPNIADMNSQLTGSQPTSDAPSPMPNAATTMTPVAARPAQRQSPAEPGQFASTGMANPMTSAYGCDVRPASSLGARSVTAMVPPAGEPRGVVASTRGAAPLAGEAHVIGWEDLAGATIAEQIKSIMAAIGALAVVLHLLKWLSTEPAIA